MMTYAHLTEQERYHIYLMNKQNHTQAGIAKTMESTISREIKRNMGQWLSLPTSPLLCPNET